MPKLEAIVDTMIPREVEKPIPTRSVTTRSPMQLKQNQDQASTIKTALVADSTPAAESVRLSPQLSALARKEQATRQKEKALLEREKALEAKLAKAERFEKLETTLTNKDYSEMEALGLNYEDYVKYVLGKQENKNPQDEKLSALEAEIAALKKSTEENQDEQYNATVAEYRKEIGKLISSDPEFSSVKTLKREEAVLQLILDSFEEDDIQMSVEEAAKLVEEYSVEEAKMFTELPKLKTQEPERKQLPRPMTTKTLTNDMTAGSNSRPLKSLQHLSESERYAEARRRVEERRMQQQQGR